MKRLAIKRRSLELMRSCGVFALTRLTTSGMARILMYHNFIAAGNKDSDSVNAEALRAQLEYVRRYFQVVPLAHIFEQLKAGRPFQRPTIALTIDDGRRNCYDVLFPLLKQFRLPATLFVVTSFIERQDWLWTDKILWLSEQPIRPSELAAENLDKTFLNLNRLQLTARIQFIEDLAARMEVHIPAEPPPQYAPCSWHQLREMAESGLVEIGSHSVTHPVLSGISDDECWRELITSRQQIEEAMGRPVDSFCYPNGTTEDYRPSQVLQVREAGYKGAVAANPGLVTGHANPYELPRLGVSGRDDALSLSKNVDGVEHYQAKLRMSNRPRSSS